MPFVSVRRATTADLDAVLRLRLALLRHHVGCVPGLARSVHPRARERARRHAARSLAARHERTWLAFVGGRAVGVLRCTISANSVLLLPERYGYVSLAYVAPSARERGVLRRLLHAAERWCAAQGLTELRLHVSPANRVAVAAWDALGFAVVDEVRRRAIRRGPRA